MGLRKSTVKSTETCVNNTSDGQIKDHVLHSRFGVTAPTFHYLCFVSHPGQVRK